MATAQSGVGPARFMHALSDDLMRLSFLALEL